MYIYFYKLCYSSFANIYDMGSVGVNVIRGEGVAKSKRVKRNVGRKRVHASGKPLSFGSIVRQARLAIKGTGIKRKRVGSKKGGMRQAIHAALTAARKFKKGRSLRAIGKRDGSAAAFGERVLPLPRSGGVLPLLPIFAGLSAIGTLAGGAAGVAKAVNEASDAKRRLTELQRHNETMEAIAINKGGRGLFLKPYRKGLGLFMKPYSKITKNY